MREHRIITAVEGKYQNIMFLIPPMCFSEEDAKKFLTALETILVMSNFFIQFDILETNGLENFHLTL